MFKKFALVTIALIATVSSLVAAEATDADAILNSRKWFRFTTEEIAAINAYKLDHKYDTKKVAVAFQEAVQKNPGITSNYDLYVTFIKEQQNKGLVFSFSGFTVVQIDLLSESIFERLYVEYATKNDKPAAGFAINFPIMRPELCIKAMNNDPAKVLDLMADKITRVYECARVLNWVEKYCDKVESARLVKSLRKIKRANYRKIAESDDWKTQMVRLELLIKSNE